MATTSPTPVLSNDHIDLLITAAASWHVLASRTTAAFARGSVEQAVIAATETEAGRLLQAENSAAVRWLSDQGRTRLVDRAHPVPYTYRPVEHLVPVEVIKAAHAAQAVCSASPTWTPSTARKLLAAIVTAATHRLEGYPDAPWSWTRPQRREGHAVGVTLDDAHPEIAGLTWVTPDELGAHWASAPIITVTVPAALQIPADLPPRSGVFVLVDGEPENTVWEALTSLEMQTLALFWPACRPWLADQIQDPAREFVEHRSRA
ncbi:hypothetical protein [Cellulosimicrobium cellulans]|uniref:hypothetical protein n=1 Tax=Cellulosimicrobium cellulans TaxID=1710 RepID=UPI0009DB41D3|nr:hypothetical protein [Cellulosimicrobium cellulans]